MTAGNRMRRFMIVRHGRYDVQDRYPIDMHGLAMLYGQIPGFGNSGAVRLGSTELASCGAPTLFE